MDNNQDELIPKVVYTHLDDIFNAKKHKAENHEFFIDNNAGSKLLVEIQKQNIQKSKKEEAKRLKQEEEAKKKFVNKELVKSCISAIKKYSSCIDNHKDCIKTIQKEFNMEKIDKLEKIKQQSNIVEDKLDDLDDINFPKKLNEKLSYLKEKYCKEFESEAYKQAKLLQKNRLELFEKIPTQEELKAEDDKIKRSYIAHKRFEILRKNLFLLKANGISISQLMTNNPFQSRPFQLKHSVQFIDAVKYDRYDILEDCTDYNYLFCYDFFKQTAIHWAAKRGKVKALKILLGISNKYLNQLDNNDNTPIALAAMNNNYEAAKILLENGANPFIKNAEGKVPRELTTNDKLEDLIITYEERNKTRLIFKTLFRDI